jgi:hypothetical protein
VFVPDHGFYFHLLSPYCRLPPNLQQLLGENYATETMALVATPNQMPFEPRSTIRTSRASPTEGYRQLSVAAAPVTTPHALVAWHVPSELHPKLHQAVEVVDGSTDPRQYGVSRQQQECTDEVEAAGRSLSPSFALGDDSYSGNGDVNVDSDGRCSGEGGDFGHSCPTTARHISRLSGTSALARGLVKMEHSPRDWHMSPPHQGSSERHGCNFSHTHPGPQKRTHDVDHRGSVVVGGGHELACLPPQKAIRLEGARDREADLLELLSLAESSWDLRKFSGEPADAASALRDEKGQWQQAAMALGTKVRVGMTTMAIHRHPMHA